MMRIDILTVVKMMMFLLLAPCGFVGRCQRFGETYCLHLQFSESWHLPSFLHGTKIQKNIKVRTT
jgi:hypothetical protein